MACVTSHRAYHAKRHNNAPGWFIVNLKYQEATALLTSGYAMVPVPRNNVFEGYYVASAGYIVQAVGKDSNACSDVAGVQDNY